MSIKKALPNYLMNFILTVFMSFSFTYALTTTLNLKYHPFIIIFAISIVTLFYSAITINKKVLKISLLSILVIFLGTIGLLWYKFGFNEIYVNIDYFCNWLYDYVLSFKVQLIWVYGILIAAFFILTVTLFVFIFTIKRFNFVVILISGSLLFTVQFVNKFLVATNTFYLFLFLMVIYYMRYIYVKNSSMGANEYINPSSFLLFIVPLCGIILFVTYIIPTRPKPIEWKWLDGKLKTFYISYFGTGIPSKFDYFSLSETGFGNNNGSLGGKISKNKNLVLKVKSPRSIYLKGAVKDTYTGKSWINSDSNTNKIASKGDDSQINYNDFIRKLTDNYYTYSTQFDNNSLLLNYIELISGISLITRDDNVIKNYFTRDNIEITYHNLSTKTIFLTENAYQINAPKIDLMLNSNGEVTTSKQMSKNSKYSFYSLNMIMNDKMENLLRKSNMNFFRNFQDDYNLLTTKIGEKLSLVCNSYIDNIDTPVEVIDVNGYKFVVFAVGQNLITSSLSFDSTLNSVVESFPKIDINNIPQRVLDVIEQNKGQENVTLSDDNVIFAGRTENAYGYLIPINDISYKVIANYFNCQLKDINVTINPLTPYIMNLFNINLQEAYTKYLQLPENLPQRIKDLAETVTASYNNRYDKVKAIETFLSDNYKYTLTPDDTPPGRDFVDYFLFDLKKGYCTYYATSMVVMLRSLGIPARYVEGYIVTSGSKKGNEYHVTNEKAHAWVEAYFEGFGWIKFEPTAAYASTVTNENRNDGRSEGSKGSKPSWIDNKNNPGNSYDLQVNQLPADNKKLIVLVTAIILVSLFVLAFAALILFNLIKGKRKLKKLTKMAPRESIINAYKLILYYMSILGYGKQDDETPKDYAARMGKSIVANHTNLKAVTNVFIIARYSNNAITDKDKAYVLDSFNNLTLYTKKNVGKLKHFVLKYLQGKI